MRSHIFQFGAVALALMGVAASSSGAAEPVRRIARFDMNREYSAPTPPPTPAPTHAAPLQTKPSGLDSGPASSPGVVLQAPEFPASDRVETASELSESPPPVLNEEGAALQGEVHSLPGEVSGPASSGVEDGAACGAEKKCCCKKLIGGICRGAHCVCLKTKTAVCNLHYKKMLCIKCGLIKTGACIHNTCAKVECCTSKVVNGLFDP